MTPQHKKSGRTQGRVRPFQQGQHFGCREPTGFHLLQRIQGAGLDDRIGMGQAPAGRERLPDFQ